MELLSLIIAILMGWWCYNIAQKEGRNEILASIMGFLFGLISVIVYYLLGNKQK